MIWFYYGVPRTGKSLFGGLVDGIIPALKEGRNIYTNIPGLSPAGLSQFCQIPPLKVLHLLHPVSGLADVFQCFDFQADQIKPEFVNTLFILDEFRSIVGLTKNTEIQFTKILNKAAKSAVDFHLIAQLPGYFDEDTRKLGEGCTVFERGERMGFRHKNDSIEFSFDKHQGTPYKLGKKWDTENWQYRYRDPKYFRLYSSYVDAQFMEEHGENHKYLGWWQTRAFKFSVAVGVLLVIMGLIFFYLFHSTTKTLDNLTNKKPKQEQTKIQKSTLQNPNFQKLNNSDLESVVCYEQVWINDGVITYKLNNGNYAYNPSYLIERCGRDLIRRTDKNL